MHPIVEKLRHSLIVSCQAEDDFPLNRPAHLTAMAQSAVLGGATAIRSSIPNNIRAMKAALDVPIIGIYKKDYDGFEVRITPTIAEVIAIVEAGCDIIAVDATDRPRPDGKTFAELYHAIRSHTDIPIMVDIATFEEGVAAAKLGVDLVATTLSGYTDSSPNQPGPDIELIQRLATTIDKPIIAEGRISSPADVRAALDAGAFAVTVGSMITRPHMITQSYAKVFAPRPTVLAVDIGGTKIAAAIVDPTTTLHEHQQVETPAAQGGPAIMQQTANLLTQLRDQNPNHDPVAIGISTGGQINQRGEIIGGTDMIPNWINFPLQEQLAKQLQLPTFTLNDGHAATLAEAKLGAGRGRRSLLCLVVGTGLGGGALLNGQIQHGANGLAGSLGQMKVPYTDGELIALENTALENTALENIVSGTGLMDLYNRRVGSAEAAANGVAVAQRARAGDGVAAEVVAEVGHWLGVGISHALHVLDVECVIVGGSVAQLGDLLLDPAREALRQTGHMSIAQTPILPAALGPQAGLIGAGLYAQQQVLNS